MNKNNNQQSNKKSKTSSNLKGELKDELENTTKTSSLLKGRAEVRLDGNMATSSNNKTSKSNVIARSNNDVAISDNNKEIALKVHNVSKIFKIPHKKIDSMRSAFVNAFNKKTYEEFYALKDVNVEVKKGEFLGIIGHNGAGKSTLLKILAGVYQPSKGTIEINGMISPFLELGIGFNPELSGRDNVYLNATVLGLSRKQINKKYQEIVEFAELENFMDEQLKNYSSGMQSRLAFSVSIHADREILIMDEVLAVGDSRFQEKCLDIFKGYKDKGKTVILVTHSIATVREYCDRALLLHKGKILGSGDVDEVCDEYIVTNMTEDQKKELEKKERIEKEEEYRRKKVKKEMQKQEKDKQKPKTKIAKIGNVEAFDESGNKSKQITVGDNFSVKVIIDVKAKKEKLDLAVQIFDKNSNTFLCGNNTYINKFNCNWKQGKNIININFKNTNFNTGQIYFKAILFEQAKKSKNNIVIDEFKNEKESIELIRDEQKNGGGMICLEHKWEKIN